MFTKDYVQASQRPIETDEFGVFDEPDQTCGFFVIAYSFAASGGGLIGLIAGLLIGGVI